MNWYPEKKDELKKMINEFIDAKIEKIHGVIVPHAGYEFSGKIAGKAYSYAKNFSSAIIFGPSHYENFSGLRCLKEAETPLGSLSIIRNDFKKIDYEHSVQNQLPFIKFLGIKKVLPLVVGKLSQDDAKKIARQFSDFSGLFVFSTDLSHFFEYDKAKKYDTLSIESIKKLKSNNIDACGINALKIFIELAKINGWKPKLIEYKNSGDIIFDKSSVVGYASFIF